MSTPLTSRKRSYNLIAGSDPKSHLNSSGNRRSLTGLTPKTPGESPQLPDVRNEEDLRERKLKRRSRTLVQSPARSGILDSTGETAKLSNDQLATHYVNCIKLSTENKITAKNAFNLHLIDHMNDMLKERCEGTLNFQMAGGTIFASAKIYASRVDAVHSEAYKVLISLGRGITEEEQKQGSDGEGTAPDEDDKETGKKKKKRSKILESNSTALRLKKVDVCWQTDALDQYYSSKFDTSCTSGLLVNNLGFCRDGVTLQYDSETMSPLSHNIFGSVNLLDAEEDSNPSEDDSETEKVTKDADDTFSSLVNFSKSEPLQESQICETISSFNWNKDHSFELPQGRLSDEDEPDVIADITNLPDEDFGGEDMEMFPEDAPESEPDTVVESEPQDDVKSFPIGMDADLVSSFMPGEYSYFKPGMFSTWEGPNHWKMKMKPAAVKQENGEDKTDPGRASKVRKKKGTFYIDFYGGKYETKEFETVKKMLTISKRIREKWRSAENDRLLPSSSINQVLDLAKSILQPEIQIRPVTLIKGSKGFGDPQHDPNGLATYNYDNPNDKNNYCPEIIDSDDVDAAEDDPGEPPPNFANCDYNGLDSINGFPDVMSQTQNMTQLQNYQLDVEHMLQGDHLVSHPKKVEKISIAYAKKATRIDVRKLKAAMWNVLKNPEDNPAKPDASDSSSLSNSVHTMEITDDLSESVSTASQSQQTFRQLYKSLPGLLPQTMAENLSIPLAFTCLLHLTNEKSLKLEASTDMSDLVITEPLLPK